LRGAEGNAAIPLLRRAWNGEPSLFFFFSNRIGCAASLLISALVTLLLLVLLGWIRW
jgi:hypothetical protein